MISCVYKGMGGNDVYIACWEGVLCLNDARYAVSPVHCSSGREKDSKYVTSPPHKVSMISFSHLNLSAMKVHCHYPVHAHCL